MASAIDNLAGSLGLNRTEADKKDEGAESLEELNSEDFMELMLAQLNNQDPTEPLDSKEMMSQMASFSTSAGVGELNDTASGIVSSLQSSQALQASSLVGRSVLVPGATARLSEGGQIAGRAELPSSTTNLRVGVYDSAGQKVDEMDLGPQAAGGVDFTWDGVTADGTELPAGSYTMEATAALDGEQTTLETSIFSPVESVSLGSGGSSPTLNLGDNRSVDFSQVREVR